MYTDMQLTQDVNLKVNEFSHSGKETMVRHFDHEGLRQLQNIITDKDLRGGNIFLLSLCRYMKAH